MEDGRRDSEAVADAEQFAIQGALRIFDQALTPEICSLLIDTFKLNLDNQNKKHEELMRIIHEAERNLQSIERNPNHAHHSNLASYNMQEYIGEKKIIF